LKKLVAAMAISGSAMLAGCVTTAQIDDTVNKAQQYAVTACGFLPTVSTVAQILSSFVPGASPVEAIAHQAATAICKAVTPVKSSIRRGDARPSVNGIIIDGKFVR
jgi:hypothetical protein